MEGTELMTDCTDIRIFLCTAPTNMCYSIDSLMGQAQLILKQDALSGHLLLFFNRSRDRIKILFWNRDGFCIWCKQLERGTFQLPRAADGEQSLDLTYDQLTKILGGIDLYTGRKRRRYRPPGSRKKHRFCSN